MHLCGGSAGGNRRGNPDADVQQAWAEIPRQQDKPQPEDVVTWIAAQLLAAGILPESAAVSEQPEMAVKR